MRKLLIFLTVISLGCTSKDKSRWDLNGGIIKERGIYQTKNHNIIIKEFEDESLIYGVSNKKNEIIFQESILQAFSKHQYWCLYWDKDDNLWAYNSDFDSKIVWLKKPGSEQYERMDFCEQGIPLPEEFEVEVKKFVNKLCPTGSGIEDTDF